MLNKTTKKRLHIHSIEKVNTSLDPEIADLFMEMRQATGQSIEEAAAQLQTTPRLISILEHGEISELPSWSEVSRVVATYAKSLGLDPDPVLRRIMLQLPENHPARPRTQTSEPSYENVRSNVNAIMNRIPAAETPVEQPALHSSGAAALTPALGADSLAARLQAAHADRDMAHDPQRPAAPDTRQQFDPHYGEMRAIPPHKEFSGMTHSGPPVAKKRKGVVFTLLMQLLVLLILLGTGYVIWLAISDPQGYDSLKSILGSSLGMQNSKVTGG